MHRTASLAALLTATLLLADAPRLQPALTPSTMGTNMSVQVTGVPVDEHAMLVGYFSVPEDEQAQSFYGSLYPAVQRASPLPSAVQGALNPHASSVGVGVGPYLMPTSAMKGTLEPLATECLPGGAGFTPAANAMGQRITQLPYYWLAASPTGPLTSRVEWGATWPGEEHELTVMNQEALVRRLLVHQFAAVGKPVTGPYDEDIDNLIFAASRIEFELHLLPIAITPKEPGAEFEPPNAELGQRTWVITFTPSSQPNGFFRNEDSVGDCYRYPGTTVYPFEIQAAAPMDSAQMLPHLELVLPGGVVVGDLQGAVGSDRLICNLPPTATSGFFFVRNSLSGATVPLAGPSGPSQVAKLLFVPMD